MANGFDMGVVVLLDYVESLATFFTHPSHDEYVRGFSFFFSIPPPPPPPSPLTRYRGEERVFRGEIRNIGLSESWGRNGRLIHHVMAGIG